MHTYCLPLPYWMRLSILLWYIYRIRKDLQGAPGSCRELQGFKKLKEAAGTHGNCRELQGAYGSCRELPGIARSCQELSGDTCGKIRNRQNCIIPSILSMIFVAPEVWHNFLKSMALAICMNDLFIGTSSFVECAYYMSGSYFDVAAGCRLVSSGLTRYLNPI